MLLLYANRITARLEYMAAFVSKELFVDEMRLTASIEQYAAYNGPKINYSSGALSGDELHIAPVELLFEEGIHEQGITCFETSGYTAFFKTEGGDFPFDPFAAAFYLLSRYEEYLPHHKDVYGRYAHDNSLAFQHNFLHLPLVNIWLNGLTQVLQQKFPGLSLAHRTFTHLPSYDIDIAYAYRHKGAWRNTGGLMRSVMLEKWGEIVERIAVLTGRRTDPFDAFAWLDALHDRYRLTPYYFFLLADKQQGYDKNIPPSARALRQLVAAHASRYTTGIHPSWQSGDQEGLLRKELQLLEDLCGRPVIHSRQHYIRMTLPETYRRLLKAGIRKDFSMGYGSINGFRASVASSFYWYDLPRETATELLIYPFCFMDANAYYEQNLTCTQAGEELMEYYATVKKVNGLMITIWHNQFAGTGAAFKGWREVHEQFLGTLFSGTGRTGDGSLNA